MLFCFVLFVSVCATFQKKRGQPGADEGSGGCLNDLFLACPFLAPAHSEQVLLRETASSNHLQGVGEWVSPDDNLEPADLSFLLSTPLLSRDLGRPEIWNAGGLSKWVETAPTQLPSASWLPGGQDGESAPQEMLGVVPHPHAFLPPPLALPPKALDPFEPVGLLQDPMTLC